MLERKEEARERKVEGERVRVTDDRKNSSI